MCRRAQSPRLRPAIVEPDQTGRRDFVVSEPESAARGLLGWRTVPRAHRDAPILDVLADLLCGGRRSRLWQSLVETDKVATWIETAHAAAHRAGQFFIQLEAAPGRRHRRRRTADRDSSCSRWVKKGLGPDELDRSRRRIKAAWRWEQEDLTSLAGGLGSAALWKIGEPGRPSCARPDRGSRTRFSGSWSLPGRRPTSRSDGLCPVRGESSPWRTAMSAAIAGSASVGSLAPSPSSSLSAERRRGHNWHRSLARPRRSPGDDCRDLSARRLQAAADGARQRPATDLRAPAGPGSRRARASCRRRTVARGQARAGLPDRPTAGRGDDEPHRARAGGRDRRRGSDTRGGATGGSLRVCREDLPWRSSSLPT